MLRQSKTGVKRMRLVAQTSEKDLAMRCASDCIAREIIDLTANLVRVGRGAGRPEDIERQIRELLRWVDAFRNAAGHGPWPEVFADSLRRAWDQADVASSDDDVDAFHHAERLVVRGALQVFASRLLGQNTQIQTGHNEMYDGIIKIGELRTRWQSPTVNTQRPTLAKPRTRKR
jgi:hypothetical protein